MDEKNKSWSVRITPALRSRVIRTGLQGMAKNAMFQLMASVALRVHVPKYDGSIRSQIPTLSWLFEPKTITFWYFDPLGCK